MERPQFLGHERPLELEDGPRLDLSQDHLFLLSPGVLQVYFQALPFLMANGNAYTSMSHRRPRLRIERELTMHGEDPGRFVKTFMDIWDDARYQERPTQPVKSTTSNSPPPQSWMLYLMLKAKLTPMEAPNLSSPNEVPAPTPEQLATAIAELSTRRLNPNEHTSSPDESRHAYEQMARRVSPILCCVSRLQAHDSDWADQPAIRSLKADFAQMFFAFPILYCWPFLEMTARGDSRALVVLYHFYRGARMLLDDVDSWWARERSRVMEGLIARELRERGLEGLYEFFDLGHQSR